MASRKSKYWVKMYMLEGLDSWAMRCNQIGEVKLFSYILSTFNKTDGSWVNTKPRRVAIEQTIGLKESTVFNYLKLLKKSGLLIKLGRSEYKVNEEFISYGASK